MYPYWNDPIFVSDVFSANPDLSILSVRYVFHFFLTHQVGIYNVKRGAGVPHVYQKKILANFFLIPIPLLKNKEIVRILDIFNTLTTSISKELPREIELRKKQYAYSPNHLLTFKEGETKKK